MDPNLLPSFLGPFSEVAAGEFDAADLDSPGGNTKTLPFTVFTQQQSQWCWAAVASSIASYYPPPHGSPTVDQCTIANKYLGTECCVIPLPGPDTDWPKNRRFDLGTPLDVMGHLGQQDQDALDFQSIVAEIKGERPVCCTIFWNNDAGNGHCIVIIGYDIANNEIVVSDPAYINPISGSHKYNSASTFVGATWNTSYRTC